MPIIWDHSERRLGRVVDSELETATRDHTEAFGVALISKVRSGKFTVPDYRTLNMKVLTFY